MTLPRLTFLVGAIFLSLAILPASASVRGVVVGVNAYAFEASLEGAVADAKDIADALKRAGSIDVRTLLDKSATKSSILTAFEALMLASAPGDTLVLTYAGHGSLMSAGAPTKQANRQEGVLLLSSFDRKQLDASADHYIRNSEIKAWFRRAEAHGLRVLFVADSCFSGALTRSLNLRLRLAPPVTSAPTSVAKDEREQDQASGLTATTTLAASLESQPAPEVNIDGVTRGALSWSFARALEGGGDPDRTGVFTRKNLENYVLSNVKGRSEGVQTPEVIPRVSRSTSEVLLDFGHSSVPPAPEKSPNVTISLIAEDGNALPLIGVDPRRGPSFVWKRQSGDVISPNGDVVAQNVNSQRLQTIVDKLRLVERLKTMAARRAINGSLTPNQALYRKGEIVSLTVSVDAAVDAVIFNLANTGEVQFQYRGRGPAPALHFHMLVTAPYGADHVIAMSFPTSGEAFEALVSRSGVTARDILEALDRFDGMGDAAVLVQPLYTRED